MWAFWGHRGQAAVHLFPPGLWEDAFRCLQHRLIVRGVPRSDTSVPFGWAGPAREELRERVQCQHSPLEADVERVVGKKRAAHHGA